MNLEQITEKISNNGYRRSTAPRKLYDEEGNYQQVYDFEHRRKMDIFSVYVNEFGSVEYIEFTKVGYNRETGKYSQQIFRIDDIKTLNKYLG